FPQLVFRDASAAISSDVPLNGASGVFPNIRRRGAQEFLSGLAPTILFVDLQSGRSIECDPSDIKISSALLRRREPCRRCAPNGVRLRIEEVSAMRHAIATLLV